MTDRLEALVIELAQLRSNVAELERQVAMLKAVNATFHQTSVDDKPLDPSIPVWQR